MIFFAISLQISLSNCNNQLFTPSIYAKSLKPNGNPLDNNWQSYNYYVDPQLFDSHL